MRKLCSSQHGFSVVEVIVSVAILSMAMATLGTAVPAGVQTSSMSKHKFDDQSMAENILRNQMEYVFEQTYEAPSGTYLTVATPEGYSVTVEALEYEATSSDIETVRVTVFKGGQQVKVLETLRANR